jgi:hypothetical protein
VAQRDSLEAPSLERSGAIGARYPLPLTFEDTYVETFRFLLDSAILLFADMSGVSDKPLED